MKKSIFIIISLILLLQIISLISVQAQPTPPAIPGIQTSEASGTGEKVAGVLENISSFTEEERNDYIKNQWRKLLQNNSFGKILVKFADFVAVLNPIWRVILGVDYSFSYFFFLAFFFWICGFIIIYQLVKNIFQGNNYINIGISAVIPSIAGYVGGLKIVTNYFVTLLYNKWIIGWLVLILSITLIICYSIILKFIGQKINASDKKSTEERRELKSKTTEKIHDLEIKGTGA